MTNKTQSEFLVTWKIDILSADDHLSAAKKALAIQRRSGGTATVFEVRKHGETDTVEVDLNAPRGLEIFKDERKCTPQERLEGILARIQADLQMARRIANDPFSLQLNDLVDIEIRPASENDQRVLVGRKDWGFTTVNYTTEGCIIDVVAEGATDSEQTISIPADELQLPEHEHA